MENNKCKLTKSDFLKESVVYEYNSIRLEEIIPDLRNEPFHSLECASLKSYFEHKIKQSLKQSKIFIKRLIVWQLKTYIDNLSYDERDINSNEKNRVYKIYFSEYNEKNKHFVSFLVNGLGKPDYINEIHPALENAVPIILVDNNDIEKIDFFLDIINLANRVEGAEGYNNYLWDIL